MSLGLRVEGLGFRVYGLGFREDAFPGSVIGLEAAVVFLYLGCRVFQGMWSSRSCLRFVTSFPKF